MEVSESDKKLILVQNSHGLESELLFSCEENSSPSPQPQPDLLIDLIHDSPIEIQINLTSANQSSHFNSISTNEESSLESSLNSTNQEPPFGHSLNLTNQEPPFGQSLKSANQERSFEMDFKSANQEPSFKTDSKLANQEPQFDMEFKSANHEPQFGQSFKLANQEPQFKMDLKSANEEPPSGQSFKSATEERSFEMDLKSANESPLIFDDEPISMESNSDSSILRSPSSDFLNTGLVQSSQQMTKTMSSSTSSSSQSVTKSVKKKKTRSEHISVGKPDVFAGVNVSRARRSFGEICESENAENNGENYDPKSKRPKSCSDEIQGKNMLISELGHVSVAKLKSSLSKFDLLEQKEQSKNSSCSTNDTKEDKKEDKKRSCKACGAQVFAMECLKAEKAEWHKSCFRCSACSRVLSVEAYESHEGKLYCKQHFKELFQPKAVLNGAEDARVRRVSRNEVIIRESEPTPLPEGVVRASDPTDTGLTDLHLDVKSKFELFENLKNSEEKATLLKEPHGVKRSGSVLAKLAKYENKTGMEVGVRDEMLAGGHGPTEENGEESSGDEIDLLRKVSPLDEINGEAVESVRSKWASGMGSSRSDLVGEHRKEEQAKFRSRLLLGKNTQIKEMYERALSSPQSGGDNKTAPLSPDELRSSENKAKGLRDLFERGDLDKVDSSASEFRKEEEVFESPIAKQSRELFRELDKNGGNISMSNNTSKPKKILRTESINGCEVIRSSDVIDEIVKPADIGSKFKFFEEGGCDKKIEKKSFRITPPRETKAPSPEVELYVDPNIIRSSSSSQHEDSLPPTTTNMLSVFRQLEASYQNPPSPLPQRRLKEFTPPPPPQSHYTNGNSNGTNNEEGSEEEEEEEEEEEVDGLREKEETLRVVGSLARASSLRAKFERWEADENDKNILYERESPSLDSTKDLRAKFENLKKEEEEKREKKYQPKVNRFVELQNSGVSMESCVECSKRVYVMEKTEAGGKIYHKNCFRCSQCKCQLRMDTFTSNKGTLYCTPHFKQLFKIKGNYDEGFGHETQRQQWEKKKAKAEDKEN